MLTTLIVVMTVALVTVAGLVALRLAMHSPKIYRGPALDPYELAQLAGGRFRVANTALASLAARGALRASRDGRLTLAVPGPERSPAPPEAGVPERSPHPLETGVSERSPHPLEAEIREQSPEPLEAGVPERSPVPLEAGVPEWTPHPLEAEVLALLGAGRDGSPVWEVKAAVVHGPAVAALIGRLEELGLADTGGGARAEPTRLGQAALVHYRLRHREEGSLPPRARDHTSREEYELAGVALYGLGRMKDRRLASLLSLSGTLPPSAPSGREPPAPPPPDVPGPSGPPDLSSPSDPSGPSSPSDVPVPSGPSDLSDPADPSGLSGPSGASDGDGRGGGDR
ncbi:TIGR04222 domain-containing membrane protein [Streptosporangium canum]|uniref:TIGR04222 domain-containing membrane protein n=1 Tax=Streptosporangium canum TaxID=324952 RepID=UPI003413D020